MQQNKFFKKKEAHLDCLNFTNSIYNLKEKYIKKEK